MNFREISIIKHKEIQLDTILYYPQVRDLCHYPYPDHPQGCPNIEKCRKSTVPYFKYLVKQGNYTRFYLVYILINFKKYLEIRQIQNPEFFNSERKLKCLIYWQNSIKSILKDYFERLHEVGNKFYVLGCGSGFSLSFQKVVSSMENVCINVFSTLKINKIPFEIKPINKIKLCNLLLSKEEINFNKKIIQQTLF